VIFCSRIDEVRRFVAWLTNTPVFVECPVLCSCRAAHCIIHRRTEAIGASSACSTLFAPHCSFDIRKPMVLRTVQSRIVIGMVLHG
jgi:hypothetical protein